MRLTRRGRIVVVAVFSVTAFFGVSAVRTASQATTQTSHPSTRAITVRPGETLWQIAVRIAPDTDPRDTVARLRDLNSLGPWGPIAGQRLIIPG
jgi:hypothetical protein